MISFKRGSNQTFLFTLNVPIDRLGSPKCVMVQSDVSFDLETQIDLELNGLICTLSNEQSESLIGGFSAWIQHVWFDGAGNVIGFPAEEVFVEEAIIFEPDLDEFVENEEREEYDAVVNEEDDEELYAFDDPTPFETEAYNEDENEPEEDYADEVYDLVEGDEEDEEEG